MIKPRALILMFLTSLVVVCFPAYAEQSASVDQRIAQGQAAFDRSDYQSAISLWQPVLEVLKKAEEKKRVADLAFKLGGAYFYSDNTTKALDVYRQALASYRDINDRVGQANVLTVVGNVQRLLGQYDDAQSSLQRALALNRELKNRRGEANDLTNLGIVEHDIRHNDEALSLYRQGLGIYREIKYPLGEAAVLSDIGIVQKDIGHYEEALHSYRDALGINREIKNRRGEATVLNNIANVEDRLGHHAEALSLYQQALSIFREIKSRRGEASTLGNIGTTEKDLGRYADALRSLQQALAIHHEIEDQSSELQDLSNIGNVQELLDNDAAALISYQQALAMQRKRKNRLGEASVLSSIGNLERRLRHEEDALRSYQQALAIHRDTKNRRGEADALAAIGLTEQSRERYDDALRSQQEALAIDREIKNRIGEANTLLAIGNVQIAQGRYDDALRSYKQALAMDREINNRTGEADAVGNIGLIEGNLGHYDEALRWHQQALTIHRQVGDRIGEASNLANIGNIEHAIGRYADAFRSHEQALAVYRDSKNRLGEADELNNIGIVEVDLGRPLDALRSYQQALAIHEDLKNSRGEAGDLASIAELARLAGRYDDASRVHQQALALHRKIKDARGEAVDLGNIGNAELQTGRFENALRFARDAIALDRQLPSPEGLWRALRTAASAEAHLNRPEAALSDYDAALTQIEALRSMLAEPLERSSYFSSKLFAYDEYIGYLEGLSRESPGKSYERKALEVLERKEARTVLEQIAGSAAQRFQGVPSDVITRDKATQDAVHAAQRHLAKHYGSSTSDAAAARAELDTANVQRTEFERELEMRYPAYYALLYPKPIHLNELQRVLHADEVMLEYDVLDDKSIIFVVTPNSLFIATLQGSVALRQVITQVHSHIDDMLAHTVPAKLERDATVDLPRFAVDSAALYEALIPRSIRPLIANKRLIIVPSGPLYAVPWEAIVTEVSAQGPHYLLEDHAISYIPSGSLLALLRTTDRKSPQRAPLLAFANPAFGNATDSTHTERNAYLLYNALRNANGGRFPDLPGAAVEARSVRDVLRAPDNSLIMGEEATRARLFSLNASHQLKTYRYVLFATHAVLTHEVKGVNQPALVLAHPNRDGFVTMADVFGLSLDADFVALSACNTGQGAGNSGEGISGLTRAFLYAGTPAISVTLWRVDDKAAPQITPAFFAAMIVGASPAEALRRAKLAMLRSASARFRHPYAWAPSVIFGDGGTSNSHSTS